MQVGAIGDRHNRDLGLPVQCAPPMRSSLEPLVLLIALLKLAARS